MKTPCPRPFGAVLGGTVAFSLLFAAGTVTYADTAVVFNEIMYHPAANEPFMEWIELHNQLAVDVDISDWSIAGGINYTFPSNTIVRGGGFALVAVSPTTLNAALGTANVMGPFVGRLSNNGDRLELRNNSGRVVDEVAYGADGNWPVAPDGSGVSLAKFDEDSASASAPNWRFSAELGGTPGTKNFPEPGQFVAPLGLASYWTFDDPGTQAVDQAGQNNGTLGGGVIRASGALTFNGTTNAYIDFGPGTQQNNFAASNGVTIELVVKPNWSGTGTAVLFSKAPLRPGSYRDTVLANRPLAYWRLDDSTTTIVDTTTNARNGTASAGVLLSQPGLVASQPSSTAARFGNTDRIIINGFEKIGPGGYTVEYWVKPNTLPASCCQNLVGDGEASGDYHMMNYILGPAQGLVGAIRPHYGPNNSPVSMTTAAALQAGNTYHVVTTWDANSSADNAVIYINGVASQVGTISRNLPAAGTTGANRVYIGKDDRDTSDGNNTIDEVALYNYPISASDVAAHFAAATVTNFDLNLGNAIQLAFQNDGKNALANPPVAAGPVLSFGLVVNGVYSELDMPLDGQSGRPTLAVLQDGSPHHLTATYNSATGLKAIFVDGTMRFSTTLSGLVSSLNGASAVAGNSSISRTNSFTGTMDNLAFWSQAISPSTVAAHYSATLAGNDYFTTTSQVQNIQLAFNEVIAATNAAFWLELMNTGTNDVVLDGLSIHHDGALDSAFEFPSNNVVLPSGGLLSINEATLGFRAASGDKLFLYGRSQAAVLDAVVVKNRHRGRYPDGTGEWLYPNLATPGASNSFAFRTELVINEIMYNAHPLPATNGLPPANSPEAWIEIFNRSSNTVDLTGWELAGGVQYPFTPGKTLAPGAYLVIADDVPFLKALYPSPDIVGDFGGRLSGRGDHIVLKDPSGNPADEVSYFDGGRWPANADGGGSSLELRDPNSDNSKAEAWAASNETGKSAWQTFTYRMVANIPAGSGQPTTWQDFILGLQSEGECLIDDLSVIELPASAPAQVIANGNFENNLTGWRVLGTHGHSVVEAEPGNPGNKVLHLVATGPQEHMHNHIETTLAGGKTITAGREYEISFRARWLAGNNLLNTRLYFNRAGRTTALSIPPLNGTPGAQNSRFAANIGPTFSGFGHQRSVPAAGEPVAVSVTAQDPQGVASVQLFWSVNSGGWNNAAMTALGGGRYQGTIPGQSAGAVVQFYTRATDSLGAAATFPARGSDSGALYKVEDGQAILTLAHNVRIILTPANIELMHGTSQGANQTNVMSNDLLPCTVVYDESRVYYDCAVHLRGSQRGRYSDTRTGFHIEFPPDDLFRGVHPVMLIDRSGAGDATANRQEEIVLKHILNRAGGIPGTYSEICRLLAPRSIHSGPAQFFPRHEDVFVESAFANGSDGRMFEMELIYYPTSTNAAGYKLPQPDAVVGTDVTDLGDDKEVYRYNFMIKNHREVDDYRPFLALAKAWSLPTTTPALDAQTRQLMDINEWMRAYALVSLCSVGDMYTFGNNHNFFAFQRPSDGKFLYFPWDMDFAFSRGASGALVGDQNLAKIVNLPGNLRLMYAHMLDIIGISFNPSYMAYWTDHYDNFAPGQSYAGSLSTITARIPFVQSAINSAGGNSPFNITGTNAITTSNNLVAIGGTAPVQVQHIKINGREYPISWTSISAWTLRVSVSDPTNTLVVEVFDLAGRPLTNLTRTITVNYTGAAPNPAGTVVINEIMFNSAAPDASFIELFNTSSNLSFDLSNWEVNGLGYTFPPGTVLTNRGFLLLAGNLSAFASTYGTNAPVPFDVYPGALQNDGETLTLLRPGAAPGQMEIVDRVRYESAPPWPTSPNGTGPSLQLLDAAQDNSRVANWSDGAGWRYLSVTGIPSGSFNKRIMLWLDSAGRVNIDDIFLALGPVAEVGSNYINNGAFEAPLAPAWKANGNNASGTTLSTAIKRSGNSSMELTFTNTGGSSQYYYYDLTNAVTPNFDSTLTYTLSFWYLPTTNASRLTARLGSAIAPNFSVRPILSTPGIANSVAQAVPAFPPLWLNEVQPENLTGITDGAGTREPWIEVVNVSSNTVSLDGYFLSDSYTNLSRWNFPAGASLAPGEFKVIFADGEPGQTAAGEWHTGFRLAPNVGSVALSRTLGNAPQLVDYLNYTNLPAGRSYGDYPDAQPFFREEFFVATPGAPNTNTAPPLVAFINEWMAANTHSLLNTNNGNRYDDWFELYNPGNSPASLDGYYLTDNLANKTQFAIPSGFRIPAHGYLLVWADGASGLNNTNIAELHVSFKLGQNGEQIGLFAPDGTMIDGVTFEPQFDDISHGHYPDATGPVYFLATATPRAPNSSWANRHPVLPFIADAAITAGQPLSFYASATDPEAPPQTLAYALDDGAPTGAVVNASSGLFSWTPSAAQMPSTNLITLRVTDNGTPALSAARTFQVVVRQELRVSGFVPAGGNNLGLTFGTIPGKLYRVDYKNALEDPQWLPLTAETPAAGTSMSVTVSMAGQGQRFYRVVQVN